MLVRIKSDRAEGALEGANMRALTVLLFHLAAASAVAQTGEQPAAPAEASAEPAEKSGEPAAKAPPPANPNTSVEVDKKAPAAPPSFFGG